MNAPWVSYRLRRTVLVLSIFAAPILGLCGFLVDVVLGPESSDIFGQVGAGAGLLVFAVSGVALTLWRCPRCGLPFFCRWWGSNPFASKCVHCELEKWAQPEN